MADLETTAAVALLVVAAAAVGAAGLWLVADGAGTDRPDSGDAGATPVESCTDIDAPGRYVLAADVADSEAGTCLRVRSSDVVLDGAGHAVDGVGAFGSAGVVVRSADGELLTNVTVRDLTAAEWDDGVRFVGVEGGHLEGVTAADNRVGVDLLDASRVTVVDTAARGNRLRGVSLVEASGNNTLRNVTAAGNAVFGVHLVGPDVRHNTLDGVVARDNEFGVVLVGAHDNALRGTEATNNHLAGIWLSAAAGNTVADSRVSRQFYGVFLSDGARDNAVHGTVAEANRVGLRLRSAHGNQLADNTVRSSGDTAVLLIASDDNRIVGTTGTDNARGIVVLRSDGNVLSDNSVG